MTGPLQLGTGLDNTGTDTGYVVQSKSVTLAQNSTTAVNATVVLPANSQIVNIIADVTTAYNSVTSAVLTVGTAAAGTQYVTSIDAKTGGRASYSFSAAQVSAMANIGTNTSVVATVTPTGTTSAGAARVTVNYVQTA
jgi:hypothetical protein